MLRERESALAIPLALLDADLLLSLSVRHHWSTTSDSVDINTATRALEISSEVLVLRHVDHSQVDPPIIANRTTDVQERRLNGAPNPLGLCPPLVLLAPNIDSHSVATHVLAIQQKRPPTSLLKQAILGRHERADDVDRLRDIGHANVLALADEDVHPDRNGKGVGEGVFLLCALLARRALGVPHVPLVEADGLAGHGDGDAVLDAGEVNEACCDFDGALGGARGCGVGEVLLRGSVDVDRVHVDEAGGVAALESVLGVADALFDHIGVPGRVAGFTAEDEDDAGVEQLEGFGPLEGLFGVGFLCHLADLPWSPHLVAESPVFDLRMLGTDGTDRGSALRCMAFHGHSFGEGWHSGCLLKSCSTRPNQELGQCKRVSRVDGGTD